MTTKPWEEWIPGVLSKAQLMVLCNKNMILNVDNPETTIKASSFDLHLTDEGYEMLQSVKPFTEPYLPSVKKLGFIKDIPNREGEYFLLEPKHTYVFRIKEELHLRDMQFYGQATAKSTIGRVDVLARLIIDGMDSYEEFSPERVIKGTGKIYLETTPMTFPVKVKAGVSLSQLRLFYGRKEDVTLRSDEIYSTLIRNREDLSKDGSISVDLSGTRCGSLNLIAFKAKENTPLEKAIDLSKRKEYDPKEYWDPIPPNTQKRLTIEKGAFYILKSKEFISASPINALSGLLE